MWSTYYPHRLTQSCLADSSQEESHSTPVNLHHLQEKKVQYHHQHFWYCRPFTFTDKKRQALSCLSKVWSLWAYLCTEFTSSQVATWCTTKLVYWMMCFNALFFYLSVNCKAGQHHRKTVSQLIAIFALVPINKLYIIKDALALDSTFDLRESNIWKKPLWELHNNPQTRLVLNHEDFTVTMRTNAVGSLQ